MLILVLSLPVFAEDQSHPQLTFLGRDIDPTLDNIDERGLISEQIFK